MSIHVTLTANANLRSAKFTTKCKLLKWIEFYLSTLNVEASSLLLEHKESTKTIKAPAHESQYNEKYWAIELTAKIDSKCERKTRNDNYPLIPRKCLWTKSVEKFLQLLLWWSFSFDWSSKPAHFNKFLSRNICGLSLLDKMLRSGSFGRVETVIVEITRRGNTPPGKRVS